ncbi:MAG TPA: extracellular solute-binding protein [Acetobacteraceae bacterium]|nr:extracellular solute-binding protein [Acetobacteraceae bacterium]
MLRFLREAAFGLAGWLALTATAAAAPVTVTLWSWSPVAPTMAAMAAAIEKAHPDIRIDATIQPHTAYFTAIKAAQASGTLPDLIGLPPGAYTQEYRPDLEPLDAIAADSWGADWQKNFAPALLTQARLGNPKGDTQFYMLPQEAEVLNLWYSRAAFARAGIAAPPANFDELVADVAKLRKAGFIGFYQGGGTGLFDNWVFMQIAAQTDLADLLAAENGAAVWDKPGMLAAAKVWEQLFTRRVVQPGALSALQYPTGANLFAAGRVGMISLGSWWLQETHLSTNPALATMSGYGKFFFPALREGGSASPTLGGVDIGWGITKNAAKSPAVEAATKIVLKELISGAGEQVALDQLNDLPAFNGMQPSAPLSPHLKALYDTYIQELATANPHQIGNPVVFNTLAANLQAVGAGTKTPEAAMQAVQKVAAAQAAN